MDSGPDVGGTADNLQRVGRAYLNTADTELVGVWVGGSSSHKTHHNPGSLGGQILDRLHFKASHGQALCQGIGAKCLLRAADKLP
jgi:hypothetical protein